jgi:signal transduction histidine kinase
MDETIEAAHHFRSGDSVKVDNVVFPCGLDSLITHLQKEKNPLLVDGISLLFHLKAWQRQLQDAERQRAQIVSEASERILITALALHDARNMLTLIRMRAEALKRGFEDCRTTDEFVDRIIKSTADLDELIVEFLAFSKSELHMPAPKPTDVLLPVFLESEFASYRLQTTEKGLRFEVRLAQGLPERVRIDPRFLRRILGNILLNAVKFTDSGSIAIGVSHGEGMLEIRVTDTGRGIEPGLKRFLFEPYEQGRETLNYRLGGVGLGLYNSRQLASRLGGDLRLLDTVPGEGTTFQIRVRAEPLMGGNLETAGGTDGG